MVKAVALAMLVATQGAPEDFRDAAHILPKRCQMKSSDFDCTARIATHREASPCV